MKLMSLNPINQQAVKEPRNNINHKSFKVQFKILTNTKQILAEYHQKMRKKV